MLRLCSGFAQAQLRLSISAQTETEPASVGLESDFRGSQFSEDSTRGSTPAWAAPECFPSAPESFKEYKYKYLQDIYAFGLVVCFVLLRRLPINARDREKSKLVVQDLEHLIPEYPWLQNFLATLSNCLEYDPAQRKRFLAGIRESITNSEDNRSTAGQWEVAI
ncbi:hypothetical protein F5882DRAFT_418637, partial [Hyaloscypha sp. PMI_1271]